MSTKVSFNGIFFKALMHYWQCVKVAAWNSRESGKYPTAQRMLMSRSLHFIGPNYCLFPPAPLCCQMIQFS